MTRKNQCLFTALLHTQYSMCDKEVTSRWCFALKGQAEEAEDSQVWVQAGTCLKKQVHYKKNYHFKFFTQVEVLSKCPQGTSLRNKFDEIKELNIIQLDAVDVQHVHTKSYRHLKCSGLVMFDYCTGYKPQRCQPQIYWWQRCSRWPLCVSYQGSVCPTRGYFTTRYNVSTECPRQSWYAALTMSKQASGNAPTSSFGFLSLTTTHCTSVFNKFAFHLAYVHYRDSRGYNNLILCNGQNHSDQATKRCYQVWPYTVVIYWQMEEVSHLAKSMWTIAWCHINNHKQKCLWSSYAPRFLIHCESLTKTEWGHEIKCKLYQILQFSGDKSMKTCNK